MTGDRWEIVSEWLFEWSGADANQREHLRARLAATHPDLVLEAEALACVAGELGGFLDTPALVLEAAALVADDRLLSARTEIGPYRIVSLVGRGGTGDVYRATDVRLERDVALKVLAPDRTAEPRRVERFFREARVTASLDHPHIVRVYDVGQDGGHAYLAAELLEGETLRARIARGVMPVNEVLRIALEIASALGAAHGAGLVHRDLKPDNIFLTRAGATKVLDFGIAKLAADNVAPDDPLTMTGVVLGTAGYLAPEQIRNASVDARADLFALGVLLFEMLSGDRAFERVDLVDTLHAILHDPPADALSQRSDVPPDLVDVVMRLLEKSPDARFQSAEGVMAALQQAEVDVVLRLLAKSPDARFPTADELIAVLERPRGVEHERLWAGPNRSVRARTSVLAQPISVVAIIIVVTASAAAMMWLRSSMPAAVSATPRTARVTIAGPELPSQEVITMVRLGQAAARRIEDLGTAERYFKDAISLRPDYAPAWAGLATVYKRSPVTGAGMATTYMRLTRDAANRALAIDSVNVDAISALGAVANSYDWDYDRAEALAKEALSLDRDHSDSHLLLYNIYQDRGQFDDALGEIHLAQKAEPQWPQLRALEGETLMFAGKYEEALQYLDGASREIDPHWWTTQTYRADALLALGRTRDALSAYDRVLERKVQPTALVGRARALMHLNRRTEAEATLLRLNPDAHTVRAGLLHALGEDDEAINVLNAAVDSHMPAVIALGVDPFWDDLRGREAFRAVMRRLNLLDVSDRRLQEFKRRGSAR